MRQNRHAILEGLQMALIDTNSSSRKPTKYKNKRMENEHLKLLNMLLLLLKRLEKNIYKNYQINK